MYVNDLIHMNDPYAATIAYKQTNKQTNKQNKTTNKPAYKQTNNIN
jgi:hypothetical protein